MPDECARCGGHRSGRPLVTRSASEGGTCQLFPRTHIDGQTTAIVYVRNSDFNPCFATARRAGGALQREYDVRR